MFTKVIEAVYLGDYKFNLLFNNNRHIKVSLENELWGEIFEPLKDESFISTFKIENGTLTWSNGADFAPEFLLELADSDLITS